MEEEAIKAPFYKEKLLRYNENISDEFGILQT
jgi:hypothetical protein